MALASVPTTRLSTETVGELRSKSTVFPEPMLKLSQFRIPLPPAVCWTVIFDAAVAMLKLAVGFALTAAATGNGCAAQVGVEANVIAKPVRIRLDFMEVVLVRMSCETV